MLETVRIPPAAPGSPHPLLVLLHGYGVDAQDLVPMVEALAYPAGAVLPQGPYRVPGGNGYRWYLLMEAGEPEFSSWQHSMELLKETLDELAAAHPAGLILGGFSQGAAMAATFACRYPAFGLKGLVVLSGYLPAELPVPPLPGLPVFVGHGREDSVLPLTKGRELADRLQAAGAAVDFHEYGMDHAVTEEEMEDVRRFLAGRGAAGR
ncbi:MAG: hypothetical protein OWV35_11470 [Firmicutes bacterium]|nr:hypothetical protein [Bacillota bacterium]